jgi:hypothetical protein
VLLNETQNSGRLAPVRSGAPRPVPWPPIAARHGRREGDGGQAGHQPAGRASPAAGADIKNQLCWGAGYGGDVGRVDRQ